MRKGKVFVRARFQPCRNSRKRREASAAEGFVLSCHVSTEVQAMGNEILPALAAGQFSDNITHELLRIAE